MSLALKPGFWSWCGVRRSNHSSVWFVSSLPSSCLDRELHDFPFFEFICICPPCISPGSLFLPYQDVASPTVREKKVRNFICGIDLFSWSSTTHRKPGLVWTSVQLNTIGKHGLHDLFTILLIWCHYPSSF